MKPRQHSLAGSLQGCGNRRFLMRSRSIKIADSDFPAVHAGPPGRPVLVTLSGHGPASIKDRLVFRDRCQCWPESEPQAVQQQAFPGLLTSGRPAEWLRLDRPSA